ncbi:MAG: hypothetical protein M1812_006657 [Candelaria pacifica]|nr:MAG: hypothetical protein M1812_006657 [Candelaria pacifica]
MATLNLSTNGPSITKSYQSVVNSQTPSGRASSSATYGQWAVFSVSAPLVNAFQQGSGGKESVLKVQSTGEGELLDLIDEFSDGRVQFAFVKVKDPNTALPKNVLIGWCGEGVPERTKGYFTSHLAAVSKVLHGYHVQITARSDRDLTPESIVRKVSDASGSKYSAGSTPDIANEPGPPSPNTTKPAFMPTRTVGGNGGFNPLSDSRSKPGANVDEDGWGEDAPQVTRTQLEKVQSAYQPTKVNMSELTSQKQEPSRFAGSNDGRSNERSDIVKGDYQPIGKVDIAALRRQAQDSGAKNDDRPSAVKGSYEPVGKVDIAAIRAKAQRPEADSTARPDPVSAAATGDSTHGDEHNGTSKLVSDRSAAFTSSERLTTLPKPKVSNRFGSNTSSFTGTTAPTPGGFGQTPQNTSGTVPVGAASRTFADEGGKTPAQVWAEKKARERGLSGASDNPPSSASPMASQRSGGGEWKSGYGGKSWAPVQTTITGRSAGTSADQHATGQEEAHQEEAPTSPAGGVGAIRDRFKGAPPMGAPSIAKSPTGAERSAPSPPPLDTSSKPNAGPSQGRGIPIPGLPSRPAQLGGDDDEDEREQRHVPRMPSPPAQPRSPTPPTPPMRSGSPIRVAMPVARGQDDELEAPKERLSPPPMPNTSLAKAVPHEEDLSEEPTGHDPARGAGEAMASASFGRTAVEAAHSDTHGKGKRALVQYDYEKAEDNELELKEGEFVTNIDMVDEDWWMGQNRKGETGLFPSNYVELEPDQGQTPSLNKIPEAAPPAGPAPGAVGAAHQSKASGPVAVAIYDYQAAEDNELSFEEHAKITGIEFPDEDWWFGHYRGHSGLFPANYVQLEE